ncbi:hypothetical protein [uncultured Dialister sp.]|jgi:hypothetical protein|uniref:hypothetical protein n=1 Tax=Dialister hominis TaxID=2582419 RepID=UPI0026DBD11C|nr:hypothetical protein [uncultured Dialister sp.]
MKKGKILLSLSILAALGSFSAPLSWAADVTNPAKKVNTTVEGNVSAGVAENEGDNAVSNILTLDTGADISGNATGGVAVEGAGNALTNTVDVLDTAKVAGAVTGGVSYDGNAKENVVNMAGGTVIRGVTGGRTLGTGEAALNQVTIYGAAIGEETEQFGAVFGGVSAKGMANNNVVKIVGSTTTYENVMGGYAWESSASGNQVFLTGTNTIGTSVFGGDGETGASNNELSIQDNSTIGEKDNEDTGYAIGGFTHTGDVLSNKLTVEGGTMNYAVGGYTETGGNAESNELTITSGTVYVEAAGGTTLGTGNASGNQATVSNATIGTETQAGTVYGGHAAKGSAYNNVVELTDTTTYDNVVGGNSWEASASGNKVTILGTSSIGTNVFGGDGKTDAAENTVIIGGSTQIGGAVVGAQAEAGDAERNTVFIQGGTIAEEVIGGDAFGGNANDNAVIVTGGTINGDIIGGISNPDTTSGNTIIIAGGTINRSVIGGYGVADGSIIGNTVDILGGTFGKNASLYGGLFIGSDYGTIEGNTLNFAAEGITVKNLANFQNINFYIDKETGSTPALLTVTNVSYISEASVHTFAENTEEIKAGGAITLLSAPKGIQAESTEINGTIIDSNYLSRHTSIENDGNNLILNVSDDDELFLNPDTKLFAETRAAGLALIGNGSDAAAVQGFEAAKAAYGEETGGFAPYASIGGFNLRHETGSYVDTNGMAANLGFARQYERDGYVDTLMPFFEYGRSDYTSHLDDGARGDGDQHYTGGGILYRRDRDDGLHYEAMIRAGRLSGDFKGNIDGIHASYDSDASYIAAEAGLGKIVSRENTSLDYYGKFFYTRLGSDSTVIHNSQEDNSYDFDSINSYRTRLGVRWTKEINKKESCYAGIGWDYEFDSDARASWRNFNTPTPTMEGSSGFLELGWKSKMTKDNPWSADFNLTGWAGKQRGITYTLGVSRAF